LRQEGGCGANRYTEKYDLQFWDKAHPAVSINHPSYSSYCLSLSLSSLCASQGSQRVFDSVVASTVGCPRRCCPRQMPCDSIVLLMAKTRCAPKSLHLHDRLGPQCDTNLKATSLGVCPNGCQSYLPHAKLSERTHDASAHALKFFHLDDRLSPSPQCCLDLVVVCAIVCFDRCQSFLPHAMLLNVLVMLSLCASKSFRLIQGPHCDSDLVG